MLWTTMIGVVYCLLFLTAVKSTSVQPKQIIYVDEGNRTLDTCCWENTDKFLCSSVKHECKCKEFQEPAADASYDQQCPTWFFPDPPQMAHANVEMTFMTLSDVMTQKKKQLYLTATA